MHFQGFTRYSSFYKLNITSTCSDKRITAKITGSTIKDRIFQKCYGVFGCFRIDGPWTSSHRPLNLFPKSKDELIPGFWLYTRRNKKQYQDLRLGYTASIKSSNIDPTKLTFVVTHGYLEHGNKNWVQKMKDELLINGDYNVIILDWLTGSGPPYTQATANTRLVGAIAAHFLVQLASLTKLSLLRVHVIGHSLGAHLSGYIGSELRKLGYMIGRITGMDPAEPNFEGTDPIVRLDSSDAYYVDVIHTDANPILSFG